MQRHKYIYASALIALASALPAQAQLVLNEFMQSNVETIMDDICEFPDSWVELYNPGTESVNLSDFSIGIEEKASKAYKLPAKEVPAGGHILVYCDKESQGLHTDFRLESGKNGAIYLFKGGEIADELTKIAKMPAPDIAYGRKSDGDKKWGYELQPTPGYANEGGISDVILSEPVFSIPGGVYQTMSFSLELSLPDDAPEGTSIHYTTDGTEPTKDSRVYSETLNFSSSRVVRAKLFAEGAISRPSTTNSYLVLGRRVTLPVVSLTTDPKYLNDSKIGIYPNNDGDKKKVDWRRPVNFEYFPAPNSEAALNQLCETRVSGGATRGAKFKSQVVYANKRFGEKRLEYEFWPNSKPGMTDIKSIMLRNAGNDFDYMYFRDAAIQMNMATHCDLDWQAYQPAIVFINGQYRGMLNIRERSNEDNIYSNYNKLEDIDMFENWTELKTGTWDNYNDFKALYSDSETSFAELEKVMDVNEFMNLMILNIFHNNLDFPGNNICMWRPTAEDGKWRWVCKDTDFGLGLYGRDANYQYFKWLDTPNYDPSNNWANRPQDTKLYHTLIGTPEGKELFINKFIVYMGDFLNGETIRQTIDSLYRNINYEYPHHRKLVNEWWPNHYDEVSNAKKWAQNRTSFMWTQLKNKFLLGDQKIVNVNLTAPDINKCNFTYNSIPMTKGTFKGNDYVGRTIKIVGTGKTDNYRVVGWELNTDAKVKTIKGNELTLTISDKVSYYIINAIVRSKDEPDLEIDPEDEEPSNPDSPDEDLDPYVAINGHHIFIDKLSEGTNIYLYSIQGKLVDQHVMTNAPYNLTVVQNGLYILKINNKSKRIYIK